MSTWSGAVSRTTTQGVYLLNADQSDAVGQGNTALTAGLSVDTTASTTAVPYKISVGPDDMVCFGDRRSLYGGHLDNEAGAGIYMAAPDFSSGQDLFPFGSTTMFGGVDGKPCVIGSLATSNLRLAAGRSLRLFAQAHPVRQIVRGHHRSPARRGAHDPQNCPQGGAVF